MIQSYHDTQEDYVAAYYYDVATSAGLYFGSQSAPTQSGQATGNPNAGGYLQAVNATPGVWSEATNHYLVAYYIVGSGYYDPYGFSNGAYCPECGQNNGYWFYVKVALYIVQAYILLGQTFGTSTHNPPNTYVPGGPVTAISQSFIPGPIVFGPPSLNECMTLNLYYQGDNRKTPAPVGASTYRAAQFITLTPAGPGGSIPASNVPDTGVTFQFAPDITGILVNGQIPTKAYDELHDCHWLNDTGQASTAKMTVPPGSSNGTSASVVLSGSAANPLAWPQIFTPGIDWNFNLTVTPDNSPGSHSFTRNYLKYNFSYVHDCYPAHELDLDGNNVYLFPPDPNITLIGIAGCLGGAFQKTGSKSGSLVYGTNTPGGL